MSENTQEVQELDRKDLKILAQKETIAELQDKVEELRVELTVTVQEANNQIGALTQQLQDKADSGEVQEEPTTSEDS